MTFQMKIKLKNYKLKTINHHEPNNFLKELDDQSSLITIQRPMQGTAINQLIYGRECRNQELSSGS